MCGEPDVLLQLLFANGIFGNPKWLDRRVIIQSTCVFVAVLTVQVCREDYRGREEVETIREAWGDKMSFFPNYRLFFPINEFFSLIAAQHHRVTMETARSNFRLPSPYTPPLSSQILR